MTSVPLNHRYFWLAACKLKFLREQSLYGRADDTYMYQYIWQLKFVENEGLREDTWNLYLYNCSDRSMEVRNLQPF